MKYAVPEAPRKARCFFRVSILATILVSMVIAVPARSDQIDGVNIRAFTGIAPQAYLVEQIGGEAVSVEVLLPPGQSPATYEPTAQQMARLADAQVLFLTGVPFELRMMSKFEEVFENLKVCDTRKGIKLQPIALHTHNDKFGGTLDPHIWLSPRLAAIQARNICNAFIEIDPANTEQYENSLANLSRLLDSVNAEIQKILEPVKGRRMYVFHPSYGYFAEDYGLQQVAIEFEGKEPSARQLIDVIEKARRDGIKALFVQPQFSVRQAETMASELGGKVVILDPMRRDYPDNLLEIARKIAATLNDSSKTVGTP